MNTTTGCYTASAADDGGGGGYINVGVSLTLKLVNLWTLIESDTGSHTIIWCEQRQQQQLQQRQPKKGKIENNQAWKWKKKKKKK